MYRTYRMTYYEKKGRKPEVELVSAFLFVLVFCNVLFFDRYIYIYIYIAMPAIVTQYDIKAKRVFLKRMPYELRVDQLFVGAYITMYVREHCI